MLSVGVVEQEARNAGPLLDCTVPMGGLSSPHCNLSVWRFIGHKSTLKEWNIKQSLEPSTGWLWCRVIIKHACAVVTWYHISLGNFPKSRWWSVAHTKHLGESNWDLKIPKSWWCNFTGTIFYVRKWRKKRKFWTLTLLWVLSSLKLNPCRSRKHFPVTHLSFIFSCSSRDHNAHLSIIGHQHQHLHHLRKS